jgi:hypothetical protein
MNQKESGLKLKRSIRLTTSWQGLKNEQCF